MRDTPERDLAVAQDLGAMADARIRELEERCRALEAERDEKAGVAEVYYNTMTSYENDSRELRARLREVEARETILANTLAGHYEIDATECKAVTTFRVRAIEAMRAANLSFFATNAVVKLLQSLSATSEDVGHE